MLNGANLNSCSRARGRARLLLQKYVKQRNILQRNFAIELQEKDQQALKDKEDAYKKKIAKEYEESKLQEVSSCLDLFSKEHLKEISDKPGIFLKKEFEEHTKSDLSMPKVQNKQATFLKGEFNRIVTISQKNIQRDHEYRRRQSEELKKYDNTQDTATKCQTSEGINNVKKHREKKYGKIYESMLKVKMKKELREMFEKWVISKDLKPETQIDVEAKLCEEDNTTKVEMLKNQLKLNVKEMIQRRNSKVKGALIENVKYVGDNNRKEEKMRKYQMINNIKELNELQILTRKEKKLKKQMKLVITEVSQLSCSNNFV